MKVIAVSGYKSHELGIFNQKHEGIKYVKKAIEQRLRPFIDEGLEWVIISGQLGVELWTAEVVYEMKAEYPQLKLAVLTPFLQQEERWKEETKMYYQDVIQKADFVDSISKRPYDNPAQLKMKNEFIVSKADGLLLVYDDETPGSPTYYLEVAKKRQETTEFPIYYITPSDLDFIVQEIDYEF